VAIITLGGIVIDITRSSSGSAEHQPVILFNFSFRFLRVCAPCRSGLLACCLLQTDDYALGAKIAFGYNSLQGWVERLRPEKVRAA
jgi:hypothetical protein